MVVSVEAKARIAEMWAAGAPAWKIREEAGVSRHAVLRQVRRLRRLAKVEPWDAVLDLEPEPHRTLDGAELDDALTVAADFIDLKSPYMAGHSRRCAQLAADAARLLGSTDGEITTLRRAALLHELGTTAVPNSILDKPGPLTRAELDQIGRAHV